MGQVQARVSLDDWERPLQGVAILLVLWSLLRIMAFWSVLPELVPIHFGIHGTVDGTGSRSLLWVAWILQFLLVGGLIAARRDPRWFNIPVPVTDDNRDRQRQLARLLLSIMSLEVSVLFSGLIYSSLECALGRLDGLPLIPFYGIVLVMVLTPVCYFRKARSIA